MSKNIHPKVRSIMEQDPIYRRYIDSGDHDIAAKLVSMGYLMMSVANAYNEAAINIMERYDFLHKKIKTTANNLMQSFDAYDKAIFSLIDTTEARNALMDDYDTFQELCDRFMHADKRVTAKEAWASDELRSPGMYLCRVEQQDFVMLLKWDGKDWLQLMPTQFAPPNTWVAINNKVSNVVERIYENDYKTEAQKRWDNALQK